MPPYVVVNPTDVTVAAPYGTFEPGVLEHDVELTNPQLRNAVGVRGLLVVDDVAGDKEIARSVLALLGALGLVGFRTPAERQRTISKAGLQEWHDLLRILARAG